MKKKKKTNHLKNIVCMPRPLNALELIVSFNRLQILFFLLVDLLIFCRTCSHASKDASAGTALKKTFRDKLFQVKSNITSMCFVSFQQFFVMNNLEVSI